jgi:hypothetical protein
VVRILDVLVTTTAGVASAGSWRRRGQSSSAYSDKIAEAICDRRNQEFRRSYALARECQAEDFAYEILEIADDSSRDYVEKTGADGKVTWVFDKEHFARQRLKIKALKWIRARMAPRKYRNR